MKLRNQKITIWIFILFASALTCTVSGAESTEPAEQALTPTVNLTLTSVFAAIAESTSSQPVVLTTTSTLRSEDGTPSETLDASTTPPLVFTQPPTTVTATLLPTRGYIAPPNDPTRTPDPGGGPLVHSGPSVIALYISPSPIIDGDFSDWSSFNYPISNVVYGSGYYLDSNDISGNFQAGWDATHLFIAIEVIDNKFVQNTSGKWLYLGDSIEILVDSNVSADFDDTSLNFDDHQLGISPGSSLTGGIPEAYMWFPRSKQGTTPVVDIAVLMTAQGYKIEIAIPWSLFGVFPAIDQHFGFAISISDNDAAGRNWQQTMVSNVPTRRLTNPTTWGDIVLAVP